VKRHRLHLVATLLLLGLSAAVYAPSLDYDFVDFDDYVYITQNEHLAQGLSGELGWVMAPHSGSWIPLTWLSFALDYELGELDPHVYHRTNVVLHLLATVLLYLALASLTRDVSRSLFVAAVFALHPVHVESVAWVTERKDVLTAVFFGLCLGSYANYARHPFSLRRYLPVVVFLALGLLAKATLVTLPLLLLLLDAWPLRRLRRGNGLARVLAEKLPLLALSAMAAFMTLRAGLSRTLEGDFAQLPLAERLANAAISTIRYVGISVWPTDLSVLYPHPGYGVSFGWAAAAAAGLVAATLGALALWRQRPAIAVGWLWFVGTLVPVSGIVHVGSQALADRFLYIPQTGLVIALAWALPDRWLSQPRQRVAVIAMATAAVAAMAIATSRQLPVWRNTVTLFEQALSATTDNAMAHQTLGLALVEAGRMDEASQHFEQAARIEPGWGKPQLAQAQALAERGEDAQARRFFQLALKVRPGWPPAQLGLARSQLEKGQLRLALRTLAVPPGVESPAEEAERHALRAYAQTELGHLAAAVVSYGSAVSILPEEPALQANLGLVLAAQGGGDAALEHLQRAEALGYDTVETRYTRAQLHFAAGSEAKGIAQLRAALELQPDWVAAVNDLSWRLSSALRAELRKPVEALELAGLASELTSRKDAEVLDTLATALAANRRFAQAAAVQDEAIALAQERSDSAQLERFRAAREHHLEQARSERGAR